MPVRVLLDREHVPGNDLLLAVDVWNALNTGELVEGRIGVVVLGQVVWAQVSGALEPGTCVLPSSLSTASSDVSISTTTPVPLSTVFVSASAYTSSPDLYYSHILRPGTHSVLATEPVLQGRALQNYTQFVLVPDDSDSDYDSASSSAPSDVDPESESDALEIDEDFLRSWDPDSRPPVELVPSAVGASALDEQSVCVSTVDLARLGMLSGHWAVVSPGTNHPERARLVQVHARDDIPPSTIHVSPLLLHNITPSPYSPKPPNPDEQEQSSDKLFLRPTLFGYNPPPAPLARGLTLARVASRAANDRRLSRRIVIALRELLEKRDKGDDAKPSSNSTGTNGTGKNGTDVPQPLLLKLHDLLVIYIDASEPDSDSDDEGEGEGDIDKQPSSQTTIDVPLGDIHPGLGIGAKGAGIGWSTNVKDEDTEHVKELHGQTPVFLKVVHIDYAPSAAINGSGDTNGGVGAGHDSTGAYTATTLGEMGCAIDPRTTRVAMAGAEHSIIPRLDTELDEDDGEVENALTPLLRATLLPNAANYGIALSALVRGPRGAGKARAVGRAAARAGVSVWEINAYNLLADTDAKTEGAVRARFEQAAACAPCVFLLRHVEALVRPGQGGKEPAMAAVLAECIRGLGAAWGATGYPVAVVATTAEPDAIPVSVMACFRHELVFEAPDERHRLGILNTVVRAQKLPLAPDAELGSVARETAALHAGDLVHLVRGARDEALKRVLGELAELKEKQKQTSSDSQSTTSFSSPTTRDLALATIPLTARDFESALDTARAAYSESIGAPKIPNVSWDDVGGLAHVKSDILDTIQLPLEHPELFADGMKKRSGILLYGPPGTGKTLLAKAVATSCALNFLSVKGPELLNMYIGESEANVRRVFQRARDARPCVVFFDELDSVAPRRGQAGDSGGVMDRIVSQLLAELDGMGEGGGGGEVFVIGATNRPDLLDPALLRPGRFDRMLYLGVSTTHADQLRIIQALTRKFRLDPTLDLAAVAERCPFNYTGADFYALCSDAMLKAMARKAEEIERRVEEVNAQPPLPEHAYPMTAQYYLAEMATPAETDVLVNSEDFFKALGELIPSVSASELEHYREVQQKFASSTINSAEKEAALEQSASVVEVEASNTRDTQEADGTGETEEADEESAPRPDKGKGKAV
ncbi:AAA-domain-containing protein [Ceratobasidium sp. AG-I]|nr:AAA-domain-containing protein [Ceratobasidium sp. AG-I]